MSSNRLDQVLVLRGLCETRSLAQDAIAAGRVKVNQQIIQKNSYRVNESDAIQMESEAIAFASRAGFKLYGAILDFHIDLTDRIVADIGASTGGFSDVCLNAGAKLVYAIDVGSDQLLPRLKNDARIRNLEHTNCRYLTKALFEELPDFACMDVSFISIKLILPALAKVLKNEQEMVVLVKPQFEAGKADIGKHGIVKNKKVHERVLSEIISFVESLGLFVHHLDVSSITGRDGNQEYVMHIKNTPSHQVFNLKTICNKEVKQRW